jgi:RHS repeat-associated protein
MTIGNACSSAQRPGFFGNSTGKERDVETGLDFFLARYYSGAQSRSLSPDDALTGADTTPPGPLPCADIGNPQSLNKYSYVLNNPLKYNDPDGHFAWLVDAAIGGAMDVAVQVAVDGKSFSEIDVKSVLISAAAGAVGGGIAANVGKLVSGKVAQMVIKEAAGIAVDSLSSVAQQLNKKGNVSLSETLIDTATGFAAGKTLGKLGEKATENSSKVQMLSRDADRMERIAEDRLSHGNSSRARVADSKTSQLRATANNLVVSGGIAASASSSQLGSTIIKKVSEKD